MSHYLVVAHQTAQSEELLEQLRDIEREDPDAQFSLVVPATRVNHLLTFVEGEAYALAQRVAEDARRHFEGYGLHVVDARAGDESPLQAISDAVGRDVYDTIVISTFPQGVSRWLKRDVHSQARRKFGLPVISVVSQAARSKV
jgi:hypothetical protein